MILRATMLSMAVLLAMLVSGCPGKKKGDGLRQACARISNSAMYGNECDCLHTHTKIVQSGASSMDFHCQLRQNCFGNSRLVNGSCQCNDGSIYNTSNPTAPCGDMTLPTQLGLPLQKLQSACSGIGQWQNSFCLCPSGLQFNARTRQCEQLVYHHTQAMCGSGSNATFYGHGGRGVCVCQDPQALFHPSFGGCHNAIGTPVIDAMCKNLYGISSGYENGRCACSNDRVWFRGSCLDLGPDFVKHVQGLPPALGCELGGKRIMNGNCGYYPAHNNGPSNPITCVRDSLILHSGKEKIVLDRDHVRVTIERAHSRFTQTYLPQEYFRIRCERYALGPGPVHYWARDIGTYLPGDPPYFGECRCAAGYTVAFDQDLGYEYCVAASLPPGMRPYSRCRRGALCGSGVNISIGSDGTKSASADVCLRDGTKFSIGIQK